MILLFLGSWRSTVIVVISIPLSILVSIIVLGVLGQTLNLMTLGGLSLAVGILVDDATVEIENVHRNMAMKNPSSARSSTAPSRSPSPRSWRRCASASSSSRWCSSAGAARSLFTPLGMAVVFAMMTSYLLSRTLVPTMVHYLLGSEVDLYAGAARLPATRHRLARPRALRRALRAAAPRVRRLCSTGRSITAMGRVRLRRLRGRLAGALPHPRAGLLPGGRRGSDSLPRRGPPRHAHRDDARVFARVEDDIHAVIPRTSSRPSSTTSACQSAASTSRSATLDDLVRRTARSSSSSSEAPRPQRSTSSSSATRFAEGLPGGRVLLPRARHHHPGAQLRAHGARSTSSSPGRSANRRGLRDCREAPRRDRRGTRGGGRAPRAGGEPARAPVDVDRPRPASRASPSETWRTTRSSP